MAIPFYLPNNGEERTPDEQLMLQVYFQLQHALRSRNAHHPSRNRELLELLRFIFWYVTERFGTWREFFCFLI